MNTTKHRIDIAKYLDEYAGGVLIFLLSIFRAFQKSEQRQPAEVRKILFIKLWGIGSIVLSEPSLTCLKRTHPHAAIHYLTLEDNRPLFQLLPVIDKVFSVPFAQAPFFIWHSIKLIFSLRRERYDIIFDGEFFAHYSVLLAYAVNGKHLVGFARDKGSKKRLLDEAVPFDQETHTAVQFLNLVRKEITEDQTHPTPMLDLSCVDKLLEDSVLPSQPYLVINVNASPLAWERRWPLANFIQLARALLNDFEYHLVLIGSKTEADYVQGMEKALSEPERIINLAGRLDLLQLTQVIRSAHLLISNDSGPIHLASALQVPVVGFYGPETPVRYGPLSDRRLVFYRDLWCSPCMSVDNAKTVNCVNDQACMKTITPKDVIPSLKAFIQNGFKNGE